jgi:CDP-diacylglycerol--serine O-phosphatidyltransferase
MVPHPSSFKLSRHKRKKFFARGRQRHFHKRPVDFLPNMVTVLSLCCGLTAIRFAWGARWDMALGAVLIAALLDALDGRLARFLGSASDFGAELDSLSDFLCFGCAPALVIYGYALASWHRVGWIFCLFFAVSGALRLARFNVYRTAQNKPPWGGQFSVGVPAPAGAFLALMPLIAQLAFDVSVSPFFDCLSLGFSGVLMLSRLPTFVFKNIRLTPRRMAFPLLGVAVTAAGLLTFPWVTLFFMGWVYLLCVPVSVYVVYQMEKGGQTKNAPLGER